MTSSEIGLIAGLALGILNYGLLYALQKRVELPETKKVLKIVALLDLALMPFLGFLIGSYVFG
jgi:hypothetical protein